MECAHVTVLHGAVPLHSPPLKPCFALKACSKVSGIQVSIPAYNNTTHTPQDMHLHVLVLLRLATMLVRALNQPWSVRLPPRVNQGQSWTSPSVMSSRIIPPFDFLVSVKWGAVAHHCSPSGVLIPLIHLILHSPRTCTVVGTR